MTPEQREIMQRHGIKMFSKTEASKRKERKEQETCKDGEHCQKVVNESELPGLLSEGWVASLVLPTGKIVVSR